METDRKFLIANTKFKQMLLPTLFMATANNVSLFVDSVVTSNLCGSDRLAAIQITTPIEAVLSFMIWTIGIGGSLLCFEKKAQNQSKEGDNFFSVAIISVLGGSVLMCLLCLIFGENILSILCLDGEIRQLSSQYLEILAFTFIPTAYVMGLNYFIRADGDPKGPFWVILIANVVNLVMDFVYILGFGLDIKGAGLATLTGYAVASVIVSKYFFSKERTVRFSLSAKGFFSRLRAIVACGFPASSIQLYNLIKSMVLNRLITGISGAAMIAFSVFNSGMFIPSILYVGIAQTLSPLAAAFYQVGDYLSAKQVAKKAFSIGIISTVILAAFAIFLPYTVMELFHVNDAAAIESTLTALRILPLAYVGLGIVFVLTYYLQAIKELKMATIIAFIDGFALSTFLAIVLGKTIGIIGVWISVPLTPVITILIYCIYSLKKGNGLLLIPDIPEGYTRKGNTDGLSETQIVENITGAIKRINPEHGFIDMWPAEKDGRIIIQIKDLGREYTEEELRSIPYETEYCRVCGINCTTVKVDKCEEEGQ